MPVSLRKSLTAWAALPALPPTPRMKRRPPCARVSARIWMTASTDSALIRRATSCASDRYVEVKLMRTPEPHGIEGRGSGLRPGVLLDRDGVINRMLWINGELDSPLAVEHVALLPRVGEAIRRLNERGV